MSNIFSKYAFHTFLSLTGFRIIMGFFFILEQNSISGACLLRKCCKGRAREGGDGGIIKETRDQYQVLWGSEGSDR